MKFDKQMLFEAADKPETMPKNIVTEVHVIPEWNGMEVRIRGLRADERDDYDSTLYVTQGVDGKSVTSANLKNQRARLLVKAIITDEGNRAFTDEEAGKLGLMNAGVIDRLY